MTIGAAALIPPVAYFSGAAMTAPLVISAGCLFGLVIGPDLDVDGGCFAFYVVRSLLGRYASGVWRIFWLPYAKLVPHRSVISHSIPGTFIRLAYLLAPLALVWLIVRFPVPAPRLEWAWFVLGLLVSDFLHISADWVVTHVRRKHGNKRFRKFLCVASGDGSAKLNEFIPG
jgi:uncharacterized metal-binding protein